MSKKVIQLTEGEFRSMMNEAITQALKENAEKTTNFKGFTFKFFGEDGLGLVTNILFTFDSITKLSSERTILTGTISYNNQSISGDNIILNFEKGTVKYHERGSRYSYCLEVDRRFKPQWDAFLQQLKTAL